jgi:hypothetical protein
MVTRRRDEPWPRQAARGVSFVVGLGLVVFAIGAVLAALFALVTG